MNPCALLIIAASLLTSSLIMAQGWAVFASGGQVFRSPVGGPAEQLYSGAVAHATWSADARTIYFIKSNGEIWRMDNDGGDAAKIADGTSTSYNPIAPYRPDPEYLLYVEGSRFYKIHGVTGARTQLHSEPRSYVGEIAVSVSGTRLAGRDVASDLYRMTVGGSSARYSTACSASVSPGGGLLTANVDGHEELTIHGWDGSVVRTLHAPAGKNWDNQKFSVNSDDYVVFKYDNESAIGIVHVPSDTTTTICSYASDYPDFFVGTLPSPDPGNAYPTAHIDAPAAAAEYAPGEQLSFSGGGDDAEDGTLSGGALSWQLDRIGDGLGAVGTATGGAGSYTFPGDLSSVTDYTLRLTVTDSGGLSDTDEISLRVVPAVANAAPVVDAVEVTPNPVAVGVQAGFTVAASDTDSDALSITWDFGDGAGASGASAQHAYAAAGRYVATVAVDDGHGHMVERDLDVSVYDPALIVIEAEEMDLYGYEAEAALIATYGSGVATAPFPGASGVYQAEVVIVKEDDGQPQLEVFIAGVSIAVITYELGAGARDPEAMVLGVHAISAGTEVRLEGLRVDGAAARVDKVQFRPAAPFDAGAGEDADAAARDSAALDVGAVDAAGPDVTAADALAADVSVSDTLALDAVVFDARGVDARGVDAAAPDGAPSDSLGHDLAQDAAAIADAGPANSGVGAGCECGGSGGAAPGAGMLLLALAVRRRRLDP